MVHISPRRRYAKRQLTICLASGFWSQPTRTQTDTNTHSCSISMHSTDNTKGGRSAAALFVVRSMHQDWFAFFRANPVACTFKCREKCYIVAFCSEHPVPLFFQIVLVKLVCGHETHEEDIVRIPPREELGETWHHLPLRSEQVRFRGVMGHDTYLRCDSTALLTSLYTSCRQVQPFDCSFFCFFFSLIPAFFTTPSRRAGTRGGVGKGLCWLLLMHP